MEKTDVFSLAKIFMNFMVEDWTQMVRITKEMNMESLMEGVEIAKLGSVCICCQM